MKIWAVQIDRGYGWETYSLHTESQDAIELAKAHRADGVKARLGKYCPDCATYTGNFAGERCRRCADKRAGEVIR